MQTLIVLNKRQAIVQTEKESYYDSYEHYLQDGGYPLPAGIDTVDFNKDCDYNIINGEPFSEVDDDFVSGVFEHFPAIHEKQIARTMQERDYELEHRADMLPLAEHKDCLLQDLERNFKPFEEDKCKSIFFTSSLGFVCNGDRRSGANIQGLLLTFAQDVAYQDYNNEPHTVTKTQLETLQKELALNLQQLYAQKWAKRDAIKNAKNKKQLKAVDLNFIMADFSR